MSNPLNLAEKLVAKMNEEGPDKTDSRTWPFARSILYDLCDGGLWVAVCSVALTLVSDPVFTIWLMLEWVNGWRRQSGLWDANVAARKLDEVKKLIDALGAEHQRFARLMGLWSYHGAIVYYEAAGQFDRAATCYREEAKLAQTDWDRARALFMASEAQVRHFICTADSLEIMPIGEYTDLERTADEALRHVGSLDAADGIRWTANINDDLVLWDWIINGHFNQEAFAAFNAAYDTSGDQKPSLEDTKVTLSLIAALADSWPEQVIDETRARINPNGASPDWVALSIYFHALIVRSRKLNQPVGDLGALAQHTHSGHLARHLARLNLQD